MVRQNPIQDDKAPITGGLRNAHDQKRQGDTTWSRQGEKHTHDSMHISLDPPQTTGSAASIRFETRQDLGLKLASVLQMCKQHKYNQKRESCLSCHISYLCVTVIVHFDIHVQQPSNTYTKWIVSYCFSLLRAHVSLWLHPEHVLYPWLDSEHWLSVTVNAIISKATAALQYCDTLVIKEVLQINITVNIFLVTWTICFGISVNALKLFILYQQNEPLGM